jgi:uridine kinase
LRKLMDFKIFVHSDDDIRLLRRLKRDVIHRGRTIEGVLKAYNRFVKSAYDEYIKPVRVYKATQINYRP